MISSLLFIDIDYTISYLLQRGVTTKLFGGLTHVHSDPTVGTSGEELLDSSELRSPSEGSVAAGAAGLETDLEAAHAHVSPSGNSLRNVYGRSSTTPLPQQHQQQQRPGSVGARLGGRSTTGTQRSGGNSLMHETAPLHQRHGPSSTFGGTVAGGRMSRLVRKEVCIIKFRCFFLLENIIVFLLLTLYFFN